MARVSRNRRRGLLPSERRAIAAMAARDIAASDIAGSDWAASDWAASDRAAGDAAEQAPSLAPSHAAELALPPIETPVPDAVFRAGGDVDAGAPPSAGARSRTGADVLPAVPPPETSDVEPPLLPAMPAAPRSSADRLEQLRMLEALLFASAEPLDEATLATRARVGADVPALLAELQGTYASRGVNLVRVAGKWAFRTAGDLAFLLENHTTEERRLSKAALETLSIIAYHQPVTRAEIEDIRGVTISKGTLDVLMEATWIRPRGRRRAPGKPLTYGTTDAFLVHFGLDTVRDLPGLAELKGAGLLDGHVPADFTVPDPRVLADLMPDEMPLVADDTADDAPELPLDAGHFDATDGDGADHNIDVDDGTA